MKNQWNYSPPKELSTYQDDWNQTLVTKINEITNMKSEKLVISDNLKPIIESLLFYNKKINKISDKYEIKFTDKNINTIIVGDKILEIINF